MLKTIEKVNSVAFSADGTRLALATGTDVRFWDVEGGKAIDGSIALQKEVSSVAFNRNGKLLASADGTTVRLWDAESLQAVCSSRDIDNTDPVRSLAFSPDGTRVASASGTEAADGPSNDATIRLWDVRSCDLLGKPFTGHSYPVWSVAFSPNGKRLASVEFPPFRGRFTAWDSSRALRWLRVQCWTYPPLVVDG